MRPKKVELTDDEIELLIRALQECIPNWPYTRLAFLVLMKLEGYANATA